MVRIQASPNWRELPRGIRRRLDRRYNRLLPLNSNRIRLTVDIGERGLKEGQELTVYAYVHQKESNVYYYVVRVNGEYSSIENWKCVEF